eukprot:13340025-Ditylum_brightwellii.AAC.1
MSNVSSIIFITNKSMLTTGLQHCSRKKSILQPMAWLLERRAILPLSSTPNTRCLDFKVRATDCQS